MHCLESQKLKIGKLPVKQEFLVFFQKAESM